jgi:hypothetical protein
MYVLPSNLLGIPTGVHTLRDLVGFRASAVMGRSVTFVTHTRISRTMADLCDMMLEFAHMQEDLEQQQVQQRAQQRGLVGCGWGISFERTGVGRALGPYRLRASGPSSC